MCMRARIINRVVIDFPVFFGLSLSLIEDYLRRARSNQRYKYSIDPHHRSAVISTINSNRSLLLDCTEILIFLFNFLRFNEFPRIRVSINLPFFLNDATFRNVNWRTLARSLFTNLCTI